MPVTRARLRKMVESWCIQIRSMKPNALAQIKLTRYRVALPQIESPPINSTERLVALRDTENQMSDFAVYQDLRSGYFLRSTRPLLGSSWPRRENARKILLIPEKHNEPKHRHCNRQRQPLDRKSTRLNSSHGYISYAVFCLKKKKKSTLLRQRV